MQVAVVGGTGSIGAPVVEELAGRGDEVRVLSRREPDSLPGGASHRRVDLRAGEGLAKAVADVDAVVDAANDSSRRGAEVLVDGQRRLLEAGAAAGVAHHVAISIVGCDRTPFGYYRTKVAQEDALGESPVPWSLLRATQFHTLVEAAFRACERARVVPTGSARIQPIAPEVVARRIADAVHAGPGGRLADVAGPEVRTLTELAAAWRARRDRALVPLHLPMVGKLGRALREGGLCEPAAAAGGPTFEEWLRAR